MSLAPILIIENENDVRKTLETALSRVGYAVDSVSSGKEAAAKNQGEQYSLIIISADMPETAGINVLEEVRRYSQRYPVILTTACGTIKNAVEAMQAGACDYLLKPFALETFTAAVKNVIANNRVNTNRELPGANAGEKRPSRQMITNDPNLISTLELAKNIAPSRATVLIQGESGTGKELLAQFIHNNSEYPADPYAAVNCAALPDTLAESELFGHEKGAFTGAVNRKIGKFESARNGSIVLDEISEMALPLQAKLLRVLQEREIDRVGGNRTIAVHARVIAISNVDLEKAVTEAKFREDLYYRINVVPLVVPPLRERRDDIPLLVSHFIEKYCVMNRKEKITISDEALSVIIDQPWKGNIRELENTIERAVLISGGSTILPEHLILKTAGVQGAVNRPVNLTVGTSVREMERNLIEKTLKDVNENRTHAAELLGISIRTLRNKLKEYRTEATMVAAG